MLVPGDDGDAEDARLEHGSGYCYAGDSFGQGEGTFHCMLAGLTARIVIDADAADIENQVHEPLVPDHRVGTEKFDMGDPFAIDHQTNSLSAFTLR
ncbi:hypothetical protein GCM10020255_028590 [Rhodococcus baikonurensis]